MELVNIILHNFISFIFILSFIVFIHEFGHYYIARLCGVRVETFSIGFGREIWGWHDRNQTRWKISFIPLGGYVKMFGDAGAASSPNKKVLKKLTKEQKKVAFHTQNVYKRIAIVFAGPAANFLLAIIILFSFTMLYGINTVVPKIDEIIPDSAAQEAGLQTGDTVTHIDGREIKSFSDIQLAVSSRAGQQLIFTVKRNASSSSSASSTSSISSQSQLLNIPLTPKLKETKDVFGNKVQTGMVGISSKTFEYIDTGIIASLNHSLYTTYKISSTTLNAIGEIIIGRRNLDELGGPVKIAKYSGQSVSLGIEMVIWFIAMISINLGLMNLLPIPGLDGGHLAYYIFEVIFRKPLPEKVQEYGLAFGFALLISLMTFATFNDVMQLFK